MSLYVINIEFILPQIHCDKPLSAIWKLRLTQANDKITIINVNSKNNNLNNNSREFISFENYWEAYVINAASNAWELNSCDIPFSLKSEKKISRYSFFEVFLLNWKKNANNKGSWKPLVRTYYVTSTWRSTNLFSYEEGQHQTKIS